MFYNPPQEKQTALGDCVSKGPPKGAVCFYTPKNRVKRHD